MNTTTTRNHHGPARMTWAGTGGHGRNPFRDATDATLLAEMEDMVRERAAYVAELVTERFTPDTDAETTRNSIDALDRDLELADAEWRRRRRLESYGGPRAPDPRTVSRAARFERARGLDLVDAIGRIADVWFSGPSGRGEYTARCPFPDHDDRSPSFTANPDKGVWHCFGCQRGGDVITFGQVWFGCAYASEALDHLEHALRLPEIAA